MNPTATHINIGAVRSVVLDFAHAGDVLPMHSHNEDSAHLVAVMRGVIVCRGEGWEQRIPAPEIHDLPPGAHEIEAAEDGTRIWNVVKAVP